MRGVRSIAYIAKASPFQDPLEKKLISVHELSQKPRNIPAPHMKAVVIDRELMLFGTGNFTHAGLRGSNELFAVTRDKKAIASLLQFAASLENSRSPSSSIFFDIDKAENPWLVLAAGSNARASAFLAPPMSGFRQHYQELTPKGRKRLERCQLQHAVFIPEEDFKLCLTFGENWRDRFKEKN